MDSGFFKYELLSVKRPDGTLTLYQYTTNSTWKMTTILDGQPNTENTDVVDGTKSMTTVGLAGEMMTNQVFDVASGILIDQQTYSDYDDQQRPRRVTYLDGTFTQTTFGCCGPESVADRDGITTSFGYDSLRRKTSETRNDITMLYTYDAAGKIVMTTRQGTNGNQIVLNKSLYDLAGRLIAETNAMSVVTTYGYTTDGSAQSVKTITYAAGTSDAATRIETYAKDGRLVKLTGTAVNPVRYDYSVEQESSVYRTYVKEIKLDASFNDTSEFKKTYTDTAGREVQNSFQRRHRHPERTVLLQPDWPTQ